VLIPYWIQRSDFTATDHDPVDADQAVNDFLGYDWEGEDRLFDELDQRSEDNCSAGFGLFTDDGRRLHVCRHDNGMFFFFYDRKVKLLGIFPYSKSEASAKMTAAEAAEAIRRFFDGDHEWLMRKCRG